jgi:hypothetical protein
MDMPKGYLPYCKSIWMAYNFNNKAVNMLSMSDTSQVLV